MRKREEKRRARTSPDYSLGGARGFPLLVSRRALTARSGPVVQEEKGYGGERN